MTMSSHRSIEKQSQQVVKSLADLSGLEKKLVDNVIQYARGLPKVGVTDIDEPVFTVQMMKQFNLTNKYMISLIFKSLRPEPGKDIRFNDFCRCICTFLSADLDLKSEFVFSVYDMNGDGDLTYMELCRLVKANVMLCDIDFQNSKEEEIKDLAELVMKILGVDIKTTLDATKFRQVVRGNNLCIDLLGQVLPSPTDCQLFKNKIAHLSPFQVRRLFEFERFHSLGEPKGVTRTYYPVLLELP